MYRSPDTFKKRLAPYVIPTVVTVVLAGASIAFASLTFSGTSIISPSSVVIDASSTISIGTSSATGVTIGSASNTVTFPGAVALSGLATATTQCLHVSTSGVVSGTGSDCGSGSGGFTAGGDLSGNSTSQTVIGLRGRSIASTTPLANETLLWNGTTWNPSTEETLGEKLRRLARVASVSNPVINPPLTPPAQWEPSTSYTVGTVVTNGGINYIANPGGISTSTGPGPSGTGFAPITDGTVTWYFYGLTNPTSSSPTAPTLTNTTVSPTGLTNTYTVTSTAFLYTGGATETYAGSNYGFPVASVPSGGNCPGDTLHWCVDSQVTFMTDAPKIAVGIYGGTPVRFIVNNQFLSLSETVATTSGSPSYLVLDFTNAGGTQARKITLESSQANSFIKVKVPPTSQIWAPDTQDNVRVIVIGDSYVAGGNGFPSGSGLYWPTMLGEMLGWNDVWVSGEGGTGYIATSSKYNFGQRLSDVTAHNPNLLIVAGGINDEGVASSSAIQAAVLSYLQSVRAALPNLPIIVLGAWPTTTGPSATRIGTENAISAAVTQFNDPLTWFVPISTDPNGPWFSGTGDVVNQTGGGNTDNYIGSDAIHPTDQGIQYIMNRLAPKIRNIINQIP